jgi:hypothetical protein
VDSELITQGREISRRLRGFAKSQLGTKSELLVQFGAAPIRRPSRRRVKPDAPPPPQGEEGTQSSS